MHACRPCMRARSTPRCLGAFLRAAGRLGPRRRGFTQLDCFEAIFTRCASLNSPSAATAPAPPRPSLMPIRPSSLRHDLARLCQLDAAGSRSEGVEQPAYFKGSRVFTYAGAWNSPREKSGGRFGYRAGLVTPHPSQKAAL